MNTSFRNPGLSLAIVLFAVSFLPGQALAQCIGSSYTCVTKIEEYLVSKVTESGGFIEGIDSHEDEEFEKQKDFINDTLWEEMILPAMRDMADELSTISTYQTLIIGQFFDAKHQLETQQTLQEIRARAHKDYHPSTGMCEFGSVAKSLAASERKAEFTALTLSQRSQDRSLGAAGTASASSNENDKKSRRAQFAEKFCDVADNNNGLGEMCKHDGGAGAVDKERINKDIDYARTVDAQWTLDIDFTDEDLTNEEEEIFALASNLYGHNVARVSSDVLEPQKEGVTPAQLNYVDYRALLAKRSVAENSFNAIVAMKSNGLPGSKDYLTAIMEDLGVSKTRETGNPAETDMDKILGENPSYYAQMEILTKKLYQNPEFYTNLYDKPANIGRKEVALQAIGLMQKFDLFKSNLRSEASLAILLELAVDELQDYAEDENNSASGEQNVKK